MQHSLITLTGNIHIPVRKENQTLNSILEKLRKANLVKEQHPRVFHENKKLEFYLLLFTTVDPWSKYLKYKILKFSDSGFLPLPKPFSYIVEDINGLGGRTPESENFKILFLRYTDQWSIVVKSSR